MSFEPMITEYEIASFFAGVGGIDLAFEQTGKFQTVYANEFDPSPVKTFESNFSIKVDNRDVKLVQPEDIPDVDAFVFGWPCTDVSVAGLRKGFFDENGDITRSGLYMEMVRLFTAKKPEFMFLENVKNLVGHDNGNTFKVVTNTLTEAGYHFKYAVLNAMNYGNVPQNRERIYIVAFRNEEYFKNFEFPLPIELKESVRDIIDFETKQDEKYYYTPGKYKGDIYEQLVAAMDDENAVYQWRRKYVRKNKSGVVPTLTANQGEGGHNVCLVKTKYGIRKMTPRECFNAQGFPKSFKLPKDSSDGKLYKQAGNSVCVTVINKIAQNIVNAMETTEKE